MRVRQRSSERLSGPRYPEVDLLYQYGCTLSFLSGGTNVRPRAGGSKSRAIAPDGGARVDPIFSALCGPIAQLVRARA